MMTLKKEEETPWAKPPTWLWIGFAIFLIVAAAIYVNHQNEGNECDLMANKIYGGEYECNYGYDYCYCNKKIFFEGGYYFDRQIEFKKGELYD